MAVKEDVRHLILDIESDDLDASVIHCLVTKEYDTELERVWEEPSEELNKYLSNFTVVGHHAIGFDVPTLNRLWGTGIRRDAVVDTVVLSRLRNSWDYNSHSLEDWGERLGYPKIKFDKFDVYTPEMLRYCKRDVEITYRLFKYLEPYWSNPKYHKSIDLEHNSAWLCWKINKNGFQFDESRAYELYQTIRIELKELLDGIQKDFPPKTYLVREINPEPTSKGTIHRKDFRFLDEEPESCGYSVGAPFSLFKYQEFNPASAKQRIEVLNKCGWKPVEKTDGYLKALREKNEEKLEKFKVYGWKVNEANLKTLPEDAPEGARKLAQYIILDSRRSTLEEWFNAFNKETKRIHTNYHHIGAWTQRKSHSKPNGANIPRVTYPPEGREPTVIEDISLRYNAAMRSLWTVPDNRLLVGTDAEGIQLRVLADHLGNEAYTKAIVDGRKENETDVHNVNRRLLGVDVCKDRDVAKTFIYAWILNAQAPKIAEILECTIPVAKHSMNNFMDSIDGLREFKEYKIPELADRGYFIGYDGRPVMCTSAHKMLAGILQCGESVVMKWANRIWDARLTKEKIWFKQVNDVHDEWQTETENCMETARYVAKVQCDSIRQAGEELGVKCRLDGSSSIGRNWKETH